MKNRNHHYSISTIVLLLSIGGIFVALGIAFLVITVNGIVKLGIAEIGAGIILPMVFILAFCIFGTIALIMGGKQIYLWIATNRARKYGIESTARIVDHKSASFGKRINTRLRYAFVLSYDDNECTKQFTTDYLYDINEFRYLKGLKTLKIKINKNFVTVCEPFPEEIYKLDSTYGIELAFYNQKPVKILLRLWLVFFILSIVLFAVSIAVENDKFTDASIITLFVVHAPFVVALAFCLIKWFKRKK